MFKPWLVHTENQALARNSQVLFSCLRKQTALVGDFGSNNLIEFHRVFYPFVII